MTRSRVIHAFSAGGVVYRLSAAPSQPTPPSASDPVDDQRAHGAGAAEATTDATPATPRMIEVALVGYPREQVWTLPKGTPTDGETREATAIREVQEETGLTVRIVAEVGAIQYWFTRKGVRYKKEVFHYLMEATGGDVALHDHEYDEAAWFHIEEACQRLTHENEVEIARRALALILARTESHSPDTDG
ncbi:MAG: NUDIX hydrolase [Ktedonobacterales bacterium]